ncbi:DUF4397 domain-containing protein [Halopseudomonas nanhaiensis]|uniref:DUF4397 domain-containing protein n=1 Tax=Halopseudomonas nanhaiensis TaxID=2830842 RepID=UPI001CC01185|nr:DUF4397 domain-containing protein [Halopseudomonas nanhaiensis]UAW98874.1 DUF4397 domain-containing protein [Halopseudomonas nanhaiensis]
MNRLLIMLVALMSLALGGCLGGSSSNDSPVAPPAGDPGADLRVFHAAADAPDVDIYINGTRAIAALPFGEATSFTRVPAEPLTVAVRAAGADSASEPAFETTITPVADTAYTVVAYGLLEGSDANAFDLLTIMDDRDTPAEGFFRLFLLHAAVQAGPVDVYLDTEEALGEPVISDFAPGEDTDNYLELPVDSYRVRLTSAGDDTVVYDSGFVDFENGLSYFVGAIDRESGLSPVSLVALLNDPAFVTLEDQRALVRAMHLSPDAPTVDVLVDGEPVGVTASFRDISEYLTVLPGTYRIGVAAQNTTSPVAELEVEAEAGMAYSVLATGLLGGSGNTAFELRTLVDERSPVEGDNVLVRVIHAAPDAPDVDVLANGAILAGLAGVPYFTASDYFEVSAGSYDLEVRPAGGGDGTAVIDLPGTALAAGSIYTVIATGLLADGLQPVVVVDP